MFEVYALHEEPEQLYKVYAVDKQGEEASFLLWDTDEREWFWDKAYYYAPI